MKVKMGDTIINTNAIYRIGEIEHGGTHGAFYVWVKWQKEEPITIELPNDVIDKVRDMLIRYWTDGQVLTLYK